MRTLTREELTAALAARQLLLERSRTAPEETIRRLTPLQGQHAPAPFIGLAARVEGFSRAALEDAIGAGRVVKTTIMRRTLHLAAADEYGAYAQVVRGHQMRAWRKLYAHLDEEGVEADLRAWFAEPRTNGEIRERVGRYDGVEATPWAPVWFARTLLPLVQLPPAGFFDDPRRSRFALAPGPLPEPADAAALVLRRYLAAFGPASRRDVAAWAGVAQRDFAPGWERVETVAYRDERGTQLRDLPGAPLPPASTPLPVRLLGNWDQVLLAYADRERIIPPEVVPHQVTLSGTPTVTVAGRVAASWDWRAEDGSVTIAVTPHTDVPRAARAEIRAEAARTVAVVAPGARVSVLGV